MPSDVERDPPSDAGVTTPLALSRSMLRRGSLLCRVAWQPTVRPRFASTSARSRGIGARVRENSCEKIGPNRRRDHGRARPCHSSPTRPSRIEPQAKFSSATTSRKQLVAGGPGRSPDCRAVGAGSARLEGGARSACGHVCEAMDRDDDVGVDVRLIKGSGLGVEGR